MIQQPATDTGWQTPAAHEARLLAIGSQHLTPMRKALDATSEALDDLADVLDDDLQDRARKLKASLADYAVNVTFVGQVKAGKTALTNVLAACPGLLPSDVNPWTSVVTTLHLNKKAPTNTRAAFQFFEQDEWEKLIVGGGRLGEIANRAGAERELENIRAQVEAMQAKTKLRLGKNFELLLGQKHNYNYFDSDLIERYVCLGEEDDPEVTNRRQGRFADLTRAADLYLDLPQYPLPLSLRDTPGVNDPFLVREQITLKSLRGSEICVVVLSAHQALTMTDMALIRIISNLDSRQVILFVNRIDELASPSVQTIEIHESIRKTLAENNADTECTVIFGSAKWGEVALQDALETLPEDSRAALFDWAENAGSISADDTNAHVWHLSGVPKLIEAIAERVSEGSAKRLLEKVTSQTRNLAYQAKAANTVGRMQVDKSVSVNLSATQLRERLTSLVQSLEQEFEAEMGTIRKQLWSRMNNSEASYVKRCIDALTKQIDLYGKSGTWHDDGAGLRVLLRTAYFAFARSTRVAAKGTFEKAAKGIEDAYRDLLGDSAKDYQVTPPECPQIPPPVGLGKTLVLDLHASWWKSWWKLRSGPKAYAADYGKLISSEARSMITELDETQVATVLESAQLVLREFLEDHREVLLRLADQKEIDPATLKSQFADTARDEVEAKIATIIKTLDSLAA